MSKFGKSVLAGMAALFLIGQTVVTTSAQAHSGTTSSKEIQSAMQSENKKKEMEARSIDHVRLIGAFNLPHEMTYKGTVVGGFSGITYNPHNNKWLIISDDRSYHNPARLYEAKINYNFRGFQTVNLVDITYLKQPGNTVYPNKNQFLSSTEGIVADPESIRFDPQNRSIWYTSEGDRSLGLNPFIRQATPDGSFISELPLTETAIMDEQYEKGFRNNLALEGSTFSADGETYWTAMEGPLLQDDAIPTPESGALSRITQYDREGNVLAEYAYPIDAIPEQPGDGKHADNGVTEILAINDQELLVLERASVQAEDGSYSNYVRVYKINVNGATDISSMESIDKENIIPFQKELVVNLNTLALDKVDNVEGMTWGKKLPNGNDTLVLVSDNNFNRSQITQIIAVEIIPEDK
ncbi:esterase-like activity of phytase family protein [Halobacillus shinanisalinarum]|uniref:Esterase-like activity of phytase family protein n=1 Tax=Halobacillus shinanisalinarum TaxID=2932258 RepID=A0ABY4GYM0_9BACI|nr:esterase-like activity of phytase family protein [Halobacillus shinanisalinarum]UOQ93296.1 esterase-like activity of phytase family protein [Halobacillus shinanisalinarum]